MRHVPPIIGLQLLITKQSDGASTARVPFTKAIVPEEQQAFEQASSQVQVVLEETDHNLDNSKLSRRTRQGRQGHRSALSGDPNALESHRASSKMNKDLDDVESNLLSSVPMSVSRYEDRFEKSFTNEPIVKNAIQETRFSNG